MNAFARGVVRWWWAVLLAWVAATVGAVALAPAFSDVAIFDEAAYLPPGSAAQQGQELIEEGWPDDDYLRTVTVAFVRDEQPLDDDDAGAARAVVDWLRSPQAPAGLGDVATHLDDPALADALASDDGHAWIVLADLRVAPYSADGIEAVGALREWLHAQPAPAGLDRYVTGPPAVAIDENAAIQATVSRTTAITLVLVSGLLLFIFRSPVAMLVPMVTVGAAYLLGLSVVAMLAGAGLEVSYLFQTFAIVVVFGAGTDYSILMMSRYADELGLGAAAGAPADRLVRARTLAATVTVLAGALVSAAASTVVGFSAQSVARFGLFRTMGPAMAVAVVVTLVAGLTLSPALMRLLGPALFWPAAVQRPPSSSLPRAPLVAVDGSLGEVAGRGSGQGGARWPGRGGARWRGRGGAR